MDYCSSCRRHLNGALVCPGCGAYAPDIAPPMAMAPPASRPDGTWYDVAPAVEAPAEIPAEDAVAVPAAPAGRAARRRQRARWKKNQRRAVVATAVALVGGGLTVASMDRQSGDRAQAATAPDNTAMGTAEERHTEPAAPASTPPGTPSARPGTPTARPSAPSAPREQSVAVVPTATPTTDRPRTPASPVPSVTSAAQSQAASVAPGTIPEPTATATPPAAPAPSPSATAPSELCLLVLCIG